MWIAKDWQDYEVLDCGDGEKLERWGDFLLQRPDPQVIWPRQNPALWQQAHGVYHRSERGGGQWEFRKKLPESWIVNYQDLKFQVRPTGFKHTGLFPEQAVNWDWMTEQIRTRVESGQTPRVLNLFAYTGGATMACAKAGAFVCHVDAARSMVTWAHENRKLSGVPEENTRFILEDALKFVQREIRRGNRYDGLLMDPPSYGRGPNGEVWKLEQELYGLVSACAPLLSERPLFFLLNSYTTGLSASVLSDLLAFTVGKLHPGETQAREIGLPITSGGVLPCGASGRWTAHG